MTALRSSIRRIGWNTLSISGGEVANKASAFLVYAAISRSSGLEALGQLSLGMALLYTFHVFGYAGLPTELTRSVANRPRSARRLLIHGYLGGLGASVVAAIVMAMLVLVMHYQIETTQVILILSLAVPFYSLSMIAEAVIRGREKMHLIAVGNLPGNLLMVLGSVVALYFDYGTLGVACVIVVSRAVSLLALHALAWLATMDCRSGRLRIKMVGRLLFRSRIFLASDGVSAFGASLIALLLSKFASEREVGMLNASYQLLQPIQILYRSVGHSAFPPLVAAARTSKRAVADLAGSILSLIVQLSVPACILMFVFAGDLLDLVYGHKGFREAAFVLKILSITLLLDPLNPVLGHGLWAVGADRTVFKIVLVNVTVSLVAGLILIGSFGLAGAAICAVLVSTINMLQHYVLFTRRVYPLELFQSLFWLTPAILASLITVFLVPWSRFISVPIALIIYGLIAFITAQIASQQFTAGAEKLRL